MVFLFIRLILLMTFSCYPIRGNFAYFTFYAWVVNIVIFYLVELPVFQRESCLPIQMWAAIFNRLSILERPDLFKQHPVRIHTHFSVTN